jgi:hypothetical protein
MLHLRSRLITALLLIFLSLGSRLILRSHKTTGKIQFCLNIVIEKSVQRSNFAKMNKQEYLICNMFPIPVKMIEDKKKFICKVKKIVYKHQYYDMNEFFTCKIEL